MLRSKGVSLNLNEFHLSYHILWITTVLLVLRWLSVLRQGEQMLLSGISTGLHTDHRSVACDYLPALRELARAERIRLANYTRRADRFFNYLQGLGITASKPCRDFLCDVFSWQRHYDLHSILSITNQNYQTKIEVETWWFR